MRRETPNKNMMLSSEYQGKKNVKKSNFIGMIDEERSYAKKKNWMFVEIYLA